MMADKAHIIKAGDVTYGVMPVPEGQALAIFKHDGDKWWGVGSADHIAGTAALTGNPIPEISAALDEALEGRNDLRDWLMHLVGSASTLNSAKRTIERLVEQALAENRAERTASGRILTDEDFEKLADEAEAGYDVEGLIAKQCRCWNEG